MNLEQNRHWRGRVGLAGAFFGLLFLLSAIDGLSVHFREQGLVLHVVADGTVSLNGPLREQVEAPEQLTFVSDSKDVWIKFEKIHRGYWLGGLMWRGQLGVDRYAAPGDYRISVFRKFAGDQRPYSSYLVRVYPDAAALRNSSKSLLERHFGVSPWSLFAFALVAAVACFGLAFYLAQKREGLLAKEGKAEIFRIIHSPDGHEVHFSLGRKDGVQPDSRLSLLDDKGNYLTTLQVKRITDTDSSATVPPEQQVQLGYIVALN